MSSAVDLRADRILELVNRLKQVLADFAARETQLTRELNTRRLAMTRRHREVNDRAQRRLDAQIADAESAFTKRSERLTAESRRGRSSRSRRNFRLNSP